MINTKYDHLRDPVTLRLPQMILSITGFNNPNEVHGIINEESKSLIIENYPLSTTEVLFLGYKEQCEKQLENYPGCIIVDKLLEKILR